MNAEPAAAPGVTEATTSAADDQQIQAAAQSKSAVSPHDPADDATLEQMMQEEGEGTPPELIKEYLTHDPESDRTHAPQRAEARRGEPGPAGKEKAGGEGEESGAQDDKGKSQKPQALDPADEDGELLLDDQQAADPTVQKLVARIHKLTAQRAEARNLARQKTEDGKTQKPEERNQRMVDPRDPLAGVTSLDELQAVVDRYEDLLDFAERHPNGAEEIKLGDQTVDYTPEEIANMRADALRVMRRAEKLQEPIRQVQELRTERQQAAETRYPEMFQSGTTENQMYEKFRQVMPDMFQRLADPELTIARYIRGLKAELAEKGPAGDQKSEVTGLANGNGKKINPVVEQLLRKQPNIAPSVPQVRTPAPPATNWADLEKQLAEAELAATQDGGSEESIARVMSLESQLQKASSGRVAAPA